MATETRPLAAQPIDFGSADNPREEISRVWWRNESNLDLMGGLSLVGAQWRTATNVTLNLVTKPVTARLIGTLRAGIYGTYRPDIDESYDLVRLIDFARYNPPLTSNFYVRAGPLDRSRLGTGHVVNYFSSQTAWDERTVGVEATLGNPFVTLQALTDNILFDGIAGARVALSPFFAVRNLRMRTFTLGISYVEDLGAFPTGIDGLAAVNVDASLVALTSGAFSLVPFVSYASFTHYGDGLFLGADVKSENFIDLARLHLRLALNYSSNGFIPGYIGTFYTVDNPAARIIRTEGFVDTGVEVLDGVALTDAAGGNDLVSELRIMFFEQFELLYAFRRHYGSQALSESHMRIFLRSDRIRFYLGQDRGGLRSFFSLINDLGDRSSLFFQTDYRVLGALWAHIYARYSYERRDNAEDGTQRYIVQRRFEPFAGLRLRF